MADRQNSYTRYSATQNTRKSRELILRCHDVTETRGDFAKEIMEVVIDQFIAQKGILTVRKDYRFSSKEDIRKTIENQNY